MAPIRMDEKTSLTKPPTETRHIHPEPELGKGPRIQKWHETGGRREECIHPTDSKDNNWKDMHEVTCVDNTRGWCIELNELITRTCSVERGGKAKAVGMPSGIPTPKNLENNGEKLPSSRSTRQTQKGWW